jgi:putative Mn2+ efflux pump MntP
MPDVQQPKGTTLIAKRLKAALLYGTLRGIRTALQTLAGSMVAVQVSGFTQVLARAWTLALAAALVAGLAALAQNAADYLSDAEREEPEPEPEVETQAIGFHV